MGVSAWMAAAFWALAFASLHLVQGECDYHARIDAGSEQTCGIENTTDVVHCWGDMQADSCSSGDVDYHSEFDVAQAARPRFKQVSAGRFHACGITLANDMRCWGTGKKAEPRAGKFKQVSASRYWNCAIRGQSVLWDPSQEDTLLCWGDEDGRNAELGKPPTDKFRSVNMGREYGCGIRLDNTVACWGPCYDETCGSQVPTGSFRSISTGEDFACAISLETDMAKCWGALNTSGIPANAPDDPFVEIGVGKNFVCGVKQIDKTIMCWADNDNHIIFRDLPEGTFADVTCGGAHACASNDNEVRCWGEESGQGETVPPPFFKICPRGPPLIADDVPASTVGSGMSHGSVALLVVLMGLACGILGAFLAVAAIRRQCGFDMAGRFVGRHHNRYSMDDDLERPDL